MLPSYTFHIASHQMAFCVAQMALYAAKVAFYVAQMALYVAQVDFYAEGVCHLPARSGQWRL